jgi:hypothetical protein
MFSAFVQGTTGALSGYNQTPSDRRENKKVELSYLQLSTSGTIPVNSRLPSLERLKYFRRFKITLTVTLAIARFNWHKQLEISPFASNARCKVTTAGVPLPSEVCLDLSSRQQLGPPAPQPKCSGRRACRDAGLTFNLLAPRR